MDTATAMRNRFRCVHEPGGTLRKVRDGQGALISYRCTMCGKSFAIGQMYREPLPESNEGRVEADG